MTRDELRGIVDGISDEQLKKILDINSSDIGKAKSGVEELKAQLETANSCTAEMEEEISRLKSSQCEADEMKVKIEELQKVIDEKNEAEREKNARAEINRRFEAAVNGATFVNDFTRNGMLEQFKAAVCDEKNIGKSDDEIYGELILGKDNIFVPEGGIPSVVASTMGFGGQLTDTDVREIMGLPHLN